MGSDHDCGACARAFAPRDNIADLIYFNVETTDLAKHSGKSQPSCFFLERGRWYFRQFDEPLDRPVAFQFHYRGHRRYNVLAQTQFRDSGLTCISRV